MWRHDGMDGRLCCGLPMAGRPGGAAVGVGDEQATNPAHSGRVVEMAAWVRGVVAAQGEMKSQRYASVARMKSARHAKCAR